MWPGAGVFAVVWKLEEVVGFVIRNLCWKCTYCIWEVNANSVLTGRKLGSCEGDG